LSIAVGGGFAGESRGDCRAHFNFFPKDIETRHQEVPRDRDIVLYCSCPNEATAARVALLLRKRGITRVRPLLGGIDAWRERKYPLDPHPATAKQVVAV